MSLQNVLLVKGGESNADKTQVGRISCSRRWTPAATRSTGLALCRLNSRADAEDVYQEVFLRLLRDDTEFPRHRAPESMAAARNAQPVRRSCAGRRGLSAPRRWRLRADAAVAGTGNAAVSCGRRYTHCRTISESRCGCTMWRATARRRSRKWSAAVRQRYARGCIAQESN